MQHTDIACFLTSPTEDDVPAVEAVRQLVLRRARAADRLDWELARSCYHEDAIEAHGPQRGLAHDNVIEIAGMRAGSRSTHFISNILVDVRGETAFSEAYCLAYVVRDEADGQRTEMEIRCRYLDRSERRGGEWKIARREVVMDSSTTRHVEVTIVPGYTPGETFPTDRSYEIQEDSWLRG